MPTYAPPRLSQNCLCRETPAAAMFCEFGHMTECHRPLSCASAGCGHLSKYGLTSAEIELAERRAAELLRSLASSGCESCAGSGLVERRLGVADFMALLGGGSAATVLDLDLPDGETPEFSFQSVCECVALNLLGHVELDDGVSLYFAIEEAETGEGP